MTRFKFFCILICLSSFAQAHNFAPSLLELREQPGGVVELLWRTPLQSLKQPMPVLPADCRSLGGVEQGIRGSATEYRYSIVCGALKHSAGISIAGLSESKTAALLRWYSVGGGQQQVLLRSDDDYFIPRSDVAWTQGLLQFTALGFHHILLGSDHLLFVLGLLMLASGFRPLLLLVTSFTFGHSISLALVSLGIIPYSPILAESLIALSVLLMACYLAGRRQRQRSHLSMNILVAGFGLLHGLGFAGVLNELLDGGVGLVPALLGFNLGIELGQLLFIVGVLGVMWVLRRCLRSQWIGGLRWAAIYAMGSVSVFWLVERGVAAVDAALNIRLY